MNNEMIMLSCQICEEPTVKVALADAKLLTATCEGCWE